MHHYLLQMLSRIHLGCAGNIKEVSSFPNGRKPPDPQERQRTRLNKAFKFGPPRGDKPRFRLTVSVPDLRVRPCRPNH